MHNEMSQKTRQEVLVRLRRSYARAGLAYKVQLLDQAVDLLGYHRKAAIRALRGRPLAKPVRGFPAVIGARAFPFAGCGPRRVRVGWRWIPSPCAAALWMTRICGCSMGW